MLGLRTLTPIEQQGGLSLNLDAKDRNTITIATGVSQWDDKSANQRNATQGTGANQPVFTENSINGLPAVVSDGSNDEMDVDLTFMAGSDYTIFVVEQRDSNKANSWFVGNVGANAENESMLFGYQTNTLMNLAQFINDIQLTVPSFESSSTATLSIGRLNQSVGHNIDIYKDGVLITNSNADTTPMLSSVNGKVCRAINGFFEGRIGEVVYYDTALTDAQVDSVKAHLSNKWGLSI